MSAITLSQAQAHLDAWMAASLAIASSQSYTIGTQTLTRANADTVLKMVGFWSAQVERLSGTGIKVYGVTPC